MSKNKHEHRPRTVFEAAAEFQERLTRGAEALAGVGSVQVGGTPREVAYREDKITLFRYRGATRGPAKSVTSGLATDADDYLANSPDDDNARARRKIGRHAAASQPAPLLICYALVNRPYILDLQPDRSLIRGLLARGADVYLIDWGTPDASDRSLDLADYIERYIHHCVEHICAASGLKAVDLLGVCQGGTLSLCYAALHPERVRKLVTMVTPVDFSTQDNLLAKWARDVDVDALVKSFGNVPGDLLNVGFMSLMPFRLTSQKYVHLFDAAGSADPPTQTELENFLRMEQWISDSPDQPGEMFRQFVQRFYKENRLVKGGLEIDGKVVDLKRVTMPVLNIYAGKDHLVPPSAAEPLRALVGSRDYRSIEFPTGHIGIYVSRRAQDEIPQTLTDWLARTDTRSQRAKSKPAPRARNPKSKRGTAQKAT